jgi:DNA topoisomerase-1
VLALNDLPTEDLVDPVASADAAGLHYVTDAAPGIRRRRAGKGWTYTAPDGSRVRDAVKYDRLVAFAEALPGLRARVEDDLGRPGLSRERVLATVVRLLEVTLIRVGNDEYRRQNGSFGLTTLRNRHVAIHGASVRLRFRGKHGKLHDVRVTDRRLARIVERCREIPGQELFQYVDEAGEHHSIGSEDVNDYLRQVTGEEFTAKDFRTSGGSGYTSGRRQRGGSSHDGIKSGGPGVGTLLAYRFLCREAPAPTEAEARRIVAHTIEQVAGELGNTVAVCRRCYVHPAVVEAYLAGTLEAPAGDGAEEAAVLDLLRNEGAGESVPQEKVVSLEAATPDSSSRARRGAAPA